VKLRTNWVLNIRNPSINYLKVKQVFRRCNSGNLLIKKETINYKLLVNTPFKVSDICFGTMNQAVSFFIILRGLPGPGEAYEKFDHNLFADAIKTATDKLKIKYATPCHEILCSTRR
jgi:hypothetical protein